MPFYKIIVPVFALFASACISLPGIDPEQPDAGASETLEVRLVTPAEPTFTNGSVDLKVEWSGAAPDNVRLFVDDTLLTTLASSFTYRWDTASVAEGSHTLKAIGASGAKTVSSDVRTVIVDRTPPQWVSRNPAPGADNVSVRQTTFEAVFSEPLKRDTVTAQAVHLKVGAQEWAATVSLSTDGKTLTMAPGTALSADAVVTVELSSELTDLAGNPVPASTPAWTWTVPALVPVVTPYNTNVSGVDVCLPYMKLDVAGRPILAFSKSDGQTMKIHVLRWNGGNWEAVGTPLSAQPVNTSPQACRLALDGAGNPMVAWTESTATATKVYVARWSGSAWNSLGNGVSNYPEPTFADGLSIRWSAAIGPVIAWRERTNTAKASAYVRRWDGANWVSLGSALYYDVSADLLNVFMSVNAEGQPVVFWDELLNDKSNTYAARWTGTDWVPIAVTQRIATGAGMLSFELDSSGTPVGAWLAYDGAAYCASIIRWSGSSWQSFGGPLSAQPGATEANWYSLRIDAEGRPVVAWAESDGAKNDVYVQRWDGSVWKAIGGALSAQPGNTNALSPNLELDATGGPVVAWVESDGATASIYVYGTNR